MYKSLNRIHDIINYGVLLDMYVIFNDRPICNPFTHICIRTFDIIYSIIVISEMLSILKYQEMKLHHNFDLVIS